MRRLLPDDCGFTWRFDGLPVTTILPLSAMRMSLWDRFYGMLETGTVPPLCPVCGADLELVEQSYGVRVCSAPLCGYVEPIKNE